MSASWYSYVKLREHSPRRPLQASFFVDSTESYTRYRDADIGIAAHMHVRCVKLQDETWHKNRQVCIIHSFIMFMALPSYTSHEQSIGFLHGYFSLIFYRTFFPSFNLHSAAIVSHTACYALQNPPNSYAVFA